MEIRSWGEPRKFDFQPKDHSELGENNGGIDFESAAFSAGAKCTMERHMQPGVNCALYALGLHLGFTDMQSMHGATGSNPGHAHIFAAETLLKVMSGEAMDVVADYYHSIILKEDGSVWTNRIERVWSNCPDGYSK